MKKNVVIIGAGYGGLALANILAKSGHKVTVCDKNEKLGGRISAHEQDGFVFDLGPSWYLMPEVFEQYYRLFGESSKKRLDLVRFTPGYKVFFENNDAVEIQGELEADAQTFERIEPGSGNKLKKYVEQSTRTYQLSVQYFLYNNFLRVRDVLRFEIIKNAPKMLQLTTQNLDRYVSKKFHDLRIKQLLEYHMVFLGSSPFQAPAIYTLMSHLDFKSGVYYPKKGMLSLVDDMVAIGKDYDITYRTDCEVKKICVKDGVAHGVKLINGEEISADIVVSNADLEWTETKLLERQYQSFTEKYWKKRQPGPGAFLLSLGVTGSLPHLRHHNLFFVEDWKSNFDDIYVNKKIPQSPSMYVCNPTKTDEKLAPKDHENLFILLPIPSGVTLSDDDEQRLKNKAIKILSKEMNIPDLNKRIVSEHIFGPESFAAKFHAWQYNAFGGESHLLSQSVLFRTQNKSKKVKNLFYVGAGTLPGIGLPMCLIGAQLTYKRIVGDSSAGPLKEGDL